MIYCEFRKSFTFDDDNLQSQVTAMSNAPFPDKYFVSANRTNGANKG